MRAYPEENVEYTFIFPNKKEYTLVFFKEDANGRLIFLNKTTDTMTSMPKDRFSYLGRFNLVSRVKVPPKEEPKIQEVPPEMIEQPEMTEKEMSEFKNEMMRNLEKIGSAEAMQCYDALKNNCEGLNQNEINNVFLTYERLIENNKGDKICKLA